MLITKVEIAKHRELARNVRDDKINPQIEDAELLDLKPLLGNDLYMALINEPTSERFVHLLEGKDYDHDDKPYNHKGLNKVLSIFSYARYILHGGFTDTAFGFVQKSNQDSQAVSGASKRDIYQKDRQTAHAYFEGISDFLSRKRDIYPEWKSNHCSPGRSRSFRISTINK